MSYTDCQIFTTSWLFVCIDFTYCFSKKNGELVYATQSDGLHKQVILISQKLTKIWREAKVEVKKKNSSDEHLQVVAHLGCMRWRELGRWR